MRQNLGEADVLMVEYPPEKESFYCCGGQGSVRKCLIVFPEIEFSSNGEDEER